MRDPSRVGIKGGSALSWFVDVSVAVLVAVMFWLLPWSTDPAGNSVVVMGLAAVVIASVLMRWHCPLTASLAALIATATGWAYGVSTDPMLAAAWCVYPSSLRAGKTQTAGPIAVVLVLSSGVLAVTSAGSDLAQRGVMAVGAIGAAWLLGQAEARRLALTRQVVQHAAEHERMRTQAAMAREVHDVVGHALTVISAEADVARNLPDSEERELRESLVQIEQRARAALEEVQALVRALRVGKGSLHELETGAAAAVLPHLVMAARVSGLAVTTRIDLPAVSPETGRVVVRVVQEALSNILRHSGATHCEVALWPDGSALTVRVDDNGVGLPAAVGAGTGLAGMRERIDEAGGELTVTNLLDGGTRVLARLPLGRGA